MDIVDIAAIASVPYILEQKPPASISTITSDPGLYSRPGLYYYYIRITTN